MRRHAQEGHTAWPVLFLLAVGLTGCGEAVTPLTEPEEPNSPSVASLYAAESTGTIAGRVLWEGDPPRVGPFLARASYIFSPRWPAKQYEKTFANPNAPVIDPQGRGVANAVVFLRRVDPARARPWDHAPVTVTVKDYRIHVRQGLHTSSVGFVRRGDEVTFLSGEQRYHALRGGGADFFTLALPTPQRPRGRPLTRAGLVELTDAAEYYWLRGYLFVSDHPYYARTDREGRFRLERVPAGQYQVVAWMPNWHEGDHDRNPETMCISRMAFRPPAEQARSVRVSPGATAGTDFHFSTAMFTR